MARTFSIQTYSLAFAGLAALLAATAVLHQAPLGVLGAPIALGLGMAKAILIAAVFMHLKLTYRSTVLFSLIGVFWLSVFLALAMTDYATRAWMWIP